MVIAAAELLGALRRFVCASTSIMQMKSKQRENKTKISFALIMERSAEIDSSADNLSHPQIRHYPIRFNIPSQNLYAPKEIPFACSGPYADRQGRMRDFAFFTCEVSVLSGPGYPQVCCRRGCRKVPLSRAVQSLLNRHGNYPIAQSA